MAPKSVPNGTVEAPIDVATLPPVVGINFGNSFASIAVFTKEGLAECIANEDGERQIACAITFQGEEIYIGNQAKPQLVKNSKNTITGFRNLLGKKFSEIPQSSQPTTSAPVIQHPEISDEPAYSVEILQPAPSPLPKTASNTPAASVAPTPRSEPTPGTRILTVSEVTTMFLRSLVQSAEDFLGKKVQGAVISVPSSFSDSQKDALEKAAEDAGVKVFQVLEEAAAVAVTTTTDAWSSKLRSDRTQLVVDVGSSSLHLSLLSIRNGLAYVIGASHTPGVGGDQIDDKLIKFFATEFTKKTKTPLTVAPATDAADKRAEAKLRLAVEHTKRTLSASPGAATCSVESLKDGIDFTGSVNRMRFDMLARPTYAHVTEAVSALLSSVGIDAFDVDEIVYVGGTTALPGLDEHLCLTGGFSETIDTPFTLGTVTGGGVGDPTTVLSVGCAYQAALIAAIPNDEDSAALHKAFERGTGTTEVKVTSATLGLLFPDDSGNETGGTWIPVVFRETPLPARRTVTFDVALTEESKRFAFEVWEVKESIRVEKVKPEKVQYSDDEGDDEEEEEEVEVKYKTIKKETLLGTGDAEALLGIKAKGASKESGKWSTTVEARFIVQSDGALSVKVQEVGKDGAAVTLDVPAQ